MCPWCTSGLGVAHEIRPRMLMQSTALEMLKVAMQGIERSIANLEGETPL